MTNIRIESNLELANKALKERLYEKSMLYYGKILIENMEFAEQISVNIIKAREGFLKCRKDEKKKTIGVCCWDLAHNSAGRAYTLAKIHERAANVELIGCIFLKYGSNVWDPIKNTKIKKKYFYVDESTNFIKEAIELVVASPYDIVHLSKPRAPNIIIGLLYRLFWGAKVVLDVDDEELSFVGEELPIDFLSCVEIPEISNLDGSLWTRIAVGLIKEFESLTVSNLELQKKYGGLILPHAREKPITFNSVQQKEQVRRKYGLTDDVKVVLFYGTPRPHKGIVEIAEAIASIGSEHIIFCIAGGFIDKSFKNKVLNVKGCKFLLIENQDIENSNEILLLADLCVIFSDEKSTISKFQFPAKVVDAFSMRIPVISNELLKTTCDVSDECFICTDLANLPNAISNVLNNKEDISTIIDNAFVFFESVLSLDAASRKIEELFKLNDNILPRSGHRAIVNEYFKKIEFMCNFSCGDESVKVKYNQLLADIKYCGNFIEKNHALRFSGDKNWDTRLVPSVTLPQTSFEYAEKFYIVPAFFNSPRNTTRYRSNNLYEQISQVADVEIIDYKNLPANFLDVLNSTRCVIILQRIEYGDNLINQMLDNIKRTPSTIVYDIDDQIFDQEEIEKWRLAGLGKSKPRNYFRAMKYADQFIVSTKGLRAKVEQLFKKPTHIIGNIINKQLLNISRKAVAKVSNDEFIIGYASGSNTHDFDLDVVINPLSRFLRDHPKVKFHCIGDVNLPISFADMFKEQIVYIPKCDWTQLPFELAKFSIQLIPLQSIKFNSYKSHIRFLESSAVGVPVIASNIGEHSQSIINGYTGILVSNLDDSWYEALEYSYVRRSNLKKMGVNARDYVFNYWSFESKFRQRKLINVLVDLSLGMLRDKISIILVIYNSLKDVESLIKSIKNNLTIPYELLVWTNSSDVAVNDFLKNNLGNDAYFINLNCNVGKGVAANHLFSVADERFIAGLDDDYIIPKYWGERMIYAAKNIPKLGWLSTNLTPESSGMRDRGEVRDFAGAVSLFIPAGVGGWVVFTTCSAREYIGKYQEHGVYGGIDGDYNRRSRSLGLTTGYVRNVVGHHKIERLNNLPWELHKQRIQDQMRIHGKKSDLVKDKFVDFSSTSSGKLICSVLISTSINSNENVWGDTHFAKGLKYSLEKLSYEVNIYKQEQWASIENSDVVIHLFGLHEYTPNPNALNILWIISHVDKINSIQLSNYDFVFCASREVELLVNSLVPWVKTEVLYQCTDISNFFMDDNDSRDIDVLFVGNSRRIYRNSVKYSVLAGVDLHVYGTKWEQYIPKKYIKGQSVTSEEVASLYRRAKIVINDHWDDQNQFGLVNNRIFDAFACGAVVLTDSNKGVRDVFGRIEVPSYSDQASFEDQISLLLSDHQLRDHIVKSAYPFVMDYCTFDARVQSINKVIEMLISTYVDYKSEFLYQKRKLFNEGVL